ncbi:MBL fold metallo-hydrolase [Dickeya fangzhongdai]|uniref:MBL fold metallo-hydrolase n=1 Tax=Dickeya fangzhongdai TaxID=1778540 RepID=UPI0004F6E83B|nr:MBL fold metallo-hydrolase [Dickeya fangzhongdai]AIR70848.1 beta-lactamase [Dickeya fangzhongdai]KGT99051.1 beta-lactamase [Dickeya fangzhongdai]
MTLLKPLAVFCLSLSLVPAFANAEAVAQVKTQPGYYRIMVGQYEITALSDGTNTMPMDKLLTRTPREKIVSLLEASYLKPQVETSINAFLVNTGKNLILVDSGTGALGGKTTGKTLANLKAAGYKPEQVDTVLVTHLHADHFGGLVSDGKLVYPNATIYVNQKDTDFWLSPDNLKKAPQDKKAGFERVQEVFRHIREAGKLKTFTDHQSLPASITAVPTPGHTPGHTSFLVNSDGQKILLWGDIVHAEAVQMPLPDTAIAFDSDSEQAVRTRDALLKETVKQGYWVAGAHMPFPGIGHVAVQHDANGKTNGYRWLPVNYSLSGL